MNRRAWKIVGVTLLLTISILPAWPHPQKSGRQAGTWDPPFKFKKNDEVPAAVRNETFNLVWETIRDDYYDPTFGGKDWPAIGAKYRPLIAGAKQSGEFHALLGKMVDELGRSHLNVTPPHVYWDAPKAGPGVRMRPAGVTLCVADGWIAVASVASDSPAWKAGLRPGWTVLKVGAAPPWTKEKILDSGRRAVTAAEAALAGAEGTSAELTVLDENGSEKVVSIPRSIRDNAQHDLLKAVIEWRRLGPRIGYIRFKAWAFDLKDKLEAALKDLRDSDGLIIDCRRNGGGDGSSINYLASVFFPESGIIGKWKQRQGDWQESKYEGSGPAAYRGRIAILVDDGSASASEVFAGFMQESGRAVILGQTSYGGVLNSTMALLPTGGTLQYPNLDFHTPKDKAIEGVGVVPDIPVEMTRADLSRGLDTVIERAVAELTKTDRTR